VDNHYPPLGFLHGHHECIWPGGWRKTPMARMVEHVAYSCCHCGHRRLVPDVRLDGFSQYTRSCRCFPRKRGICRDIHALPYIHRYVSIHRRPRPKDERHDVLSLGISDLDRSILICPAWNPDSRSYSRTYLWRAIGIGIVCRAWQRRIKEMALDLRRSRGDDLTCRHNILVQSR